VSAGAITTVGVELGARRYDVLIGPIAPAEAAAAIAGALGTVTGAAVLVDGDVGKRSPRVEPLVEALRTRLPGVKRYDLPPGESSKTLAEIERTTQWLAEQGYDRRAAIVGIGGGAATDHAGFAAAVYLRGVRFALVPTTLLAMVDASVGGKTAVDLPAGKNLVGAFHPPAAVLADTDALAELPDAEFRSGLAEVVKCGFIADAEILRLLTADPTGLGDTVELIARAVQVKADAVGEDLYDTGRREFLNYGHTLGHAIERVEDFGWRHGEAIAVGMVFVAELAGQADLLSRADADRHRSLLEAIGLPTRYAGDWAALQAVMRVDKKARGASLRFVVLDGIGNPTILTDPDQAWLDAAWSAVSKETA
jgi:3-dehydroquinate synthase